MNLDSRLEQAIKQVNGNLPAERSLVDKAIAMMDPIPRTFFSMPEVRQELEKRGNRLANFLKTGQERLTFWNGACHPADSQHLPEGMRGPKVGDWNHPVIIHSQAATSADKA